MANYYLELAPGQDSISEIYSAEVCQNACFKLDRPLHCQHNFVPLCLRDGQWFLMQNNEEHVLEGRWTPIKR